MAGSDFVLVVAAGDSTAFNAAPAADMAIAADGGLDLALALGIEIHVVVGDMDSVDPTNLAAAEERGVQIIRHPLHKDETDLELALALATVESPLRIHVLVGAGGRLDHATANIAVLASPRWAGAEVSADVGAARVWVVRGRRSLPLAVGDPLALHAIGGPATEVTTHGLAYALTGETLDPFEARGVANEVVAESVRIEVGNGVVVAINAPR